MTGDPFLLAGPALISFSGGRTSAYMLRRILDAHDGALPGDVRVCFANTGKEREETLRFVHECSTRWGVDVTWVEYRRGEPSFEIVGYNSASRRGQPFKALIQQKQRLPNWQERWCTSFLKVRPMHAFMRADLGLEPGQYTEVIGLRDDEGMRILKGLDRAETEGRRVAYPLARAKVTKPVVMAFWREQPFRLHLESWEGNCDLCFLKGRAIRKQIIRDRPEIAQWWDSRERETEGFFDRRDRVCDLVAEVARSPLLFDQQTLPDDDHDVECGLHCG